ncbi:hypothetical protein GCM10018966_053190 [Streptomyces yanii]
MEPCIGTHFTSAEGFRPEAVTKTYVTRMVSRLRASSRTHPGPSTRDAGQATPWARPAHEGILRKTANVDPVMLPREANGGLARSSEAESSGKTDGNAAVVRAEPAGPA